MRSNSKPDISPELKAVIKSSPAIVHKGRYAYLKTKAVPDGNHFMVCKDKDEITLITEEKKVTKIVHEKSLKWFRLIELKVSAPFPLAKGFLAAVSDAIASDGMSIMIVSTFSKDYVLIHEEDIEKAIVALKNLGFRITGN